MLKNARDDEGTRLIMGMPYNVNQNLSKNPIQLPFFLTLLAFFLIIIFQVRVFL